MLGFRELILIEQLELENINLRHLTNDDKLKILKLYYIFCKKEVELFDLAKQKQREDSRCFCLLRLNYFY